MGSTLEHGIYLPSEGEKNCYSGLANNWQTVDTNIGYVTALRQAIAGALTRQIVTQLPTEDIDPNCIYMILKATAQTSNIYDEYMYINSSWELIGDSQLDLSNYYTKQEVNQLPAVASGVTGTKVGNYDTHIADTNIHVTASDKTKWNTVALIKQLRLVNAQVGSATTIAFSDIDDTNGIKVGDKCMDLDAKLFEISAVDTANQTVTVGSALVDIALDANVVHTSGNETVGGQKTFSGIAVLNSYLYFTNSSVTKGTIPQTSVNPYRIYFGSGTNYGASLFNIDTSVSDAGVQSFVFRSAENVVSGDDARMALTYDPNRTQPRYLGLKGSIEPNANATYDCGSSSYMWKDLYGYHGYFCGQQKGGEFSSNARTNLTLLANRDTLGKSGAYISRFRQNKAQGSMGSSDLQMLAVDFLENEVRTNSVLSIQAKGWVDDAPTTVTVQSGVSDYSFGTTSAPCKINNLNPSALSFPDFDNAIDISGYVSVVANANKESLYTPPANGWICVRLSRTSGALGVLLIQGDLAVSGKNIEVESGATTADATIPVIGGVQVSINSALADGVVSAKFYPCLGNV